MSHSGPIELKVMIELKVIESSAQKRRASQKPSDPRSAIGEATRRRDGTATVAGEHRSPEHSRTSEGQSVRFCWQWFFGTQSTSLLNLSAFM